MSEPYLLPLEVLIQKSSKRTEKIRINLNWYRNAHFIFSNKAKIEFAEKVKHFVSNKKFQWPILTVYRLYSGDNRRKDLINCCAIVAKFFEDCLVKKGCIPDDNVNIISKVLFEFMGIDKGKERLEVSIIEL